MQSQMQQYETSLRHLDDEIRHLESRLHDFAGFLFDEASNELQRLYEQRRVLIASIESAKSASP